MTLLLALDPGGTPSSSKSRSATGWSLWSYGAIDPLAPIAHGQVSGDQSTFIRWWKSEAESFGVDEIVCESFRLDGRTPYPDTTPLKVEGALEALAGVPVAFQPNIMKAHLRDDRIKELGLWWPGEPHAIDSMRHAFAFMKVRGHRPTQYMAWPPRAR